MNKAVVFAGLLSLAVAVGTTGVSAQGGGYGGGGGGGYVGPGSGSGMGRYGPGSGTGMGRCRPVNVRVCGRGFGDGRGPRCWIQQEMRC